MFQGILVFLFMFIFNEEVIRRAKYAIWTFFLRTHVTICNQFNKAQMKGKPSGNPCSSRVFGQGTSLYYCFLLSFKIRLARKRNSKKPSPCSCSCFTRIRRPIKEPNAVDVGEVSGEKSQIQPVITIEDTSGKHPEGKPAAVTWTKRPAKAKGLGSRSRASPRKKVPILATPEDDLTSEVGCDLVSAQAHWVHQMIIPPNFPPN